MALQGLGKGGLCSVAAVVVLVAGCCLDGALGSQAYSQARTLPGSVYPYTCPLDVTLYKMRFEQGERAYVQYIDYVAPVPALTSFTMHYWFNLADTTQTSTFFNYGFEPYDKNDNLTVQLQSYGDGQLQYWLITMNGVTVSEARAIPPIRKGQWYHALHSWDSNTGAITHFINGNLLKVQTNYKTKGMVVPGGGVGVSGQHQNIGRTMGEMDQGEGLSGEFALFQLSHKPIGISSSSAANAINKAKLAFQCSPEMDGDVISWKTPRRNYGGPTTVPSDSKVCGAF